MRYEEIISAMEDEESINKTKLYDEVLEKWGQDTVIMALLEEMSELQKLLLKYLKGSCKRTNIAENIASINIFLEILTQFFESETLVHSYEKYKLERLKRQLD